MRTLMLSVASTAALAFASGTASASDALNPDGFASSGVLDLTSGAYTIDTSGGAGGRPQLLDGSTVLATGSLYHQGGSIDPTIGVLDFNSVTIGYGVTITVTGSNPLALLSRGSQSISGQILANGQGGESAGAGGAGGAGGPGGFSGGAGVPSGQHTGGSPGNGPGGGLTTFGGYYGFGAGGAYGGSSAGGLFNDPAYGGMKYGDLNTALLGGSGGSGSGGAFGDPGGGGGGGGGAIELVAADSISITSQSFQSDGLVQANGGGGGPGDAPSGGGGSGGGIIIAAPTLAFSGNMTSVEASGAGWDGGGGRILLLSDANGLTFGGAPYSAAGLDFYVSTNPQIEGYSSGVVQVENLNGFISPGVPEPSTWAMTLLGFAGLGFVARRRATLQRGRVFGAA